jgi:hypothetical protein
MVCTVQVESNEIEAPVLEGPARRWVSRERYGLRANDELPCDTFSDPVGLVSSSAKRFAMGLVEPVRYLGGSLGRLKAKPLLAVAALEAAT